MEIISSTENYFYRRKLGQIIFSGVDQRGAVEAGRIHRNANTSPSYHQAKILFDH
jgi:hypothetical protein